MLVESLLNVLNETEIRTLNYTPMAFKLFKVELPWGDVVLELHAYNNGSVVNYRQFKPGNSFTGVAVQIAGCVSFQSDGEEPTVEQIVTDLENLVNRS